jgi:hypothetical protein
MPLVGLHFDETFAFARPIAAEHRDAAGDLVEAAAGDPRFDYDEAGMALGLLIEGGPYFGAADRASVLAGDWEILGPATVFHDFAAAGGQPERRAYYSRSARATIDALLGEAGHHRRIGAIPGHLRNLGGFVRYRNETWHLPAAIGDSDGALVSDGDDADRPLIEG